MEYLKMATMAVSTVTALSLGTLYLFQRKIIYPATLNKAREYVETPNLPHKEVYLVTKDGEKLHSLIFQHEFEPMKRKTVLILCPNAGNIGHFLPVIYYIFNVLEHNVFIYQYRGYGYSTGAPDERGLKIDADRAIEYILSDPILSKTSLVLYGRSLGGAVALYIAAKYGKDFPKMAVIVENTFWDLPHVVPHIFPLLGYLGENILSMMVTEKWPSYLEVTKIEDRIPVLFLSGTKDEIVPPSHMKELFDLKNGTKVWRDFPTRHNDTITANGYWETWDQFVNTYL